MPRQPQFLPEARPRHHSAEQVRGGEIVLRSRGRRLVFFAGLALGVLLFILLRIAGLM